MSLVSPDCCEKCGRPLETTLAGIKFDAHGVTLDGKLLPIRGRKQLLLRRLARSPGEYVARESIFGFVWGDADVEPKNLEVQMNLLRKDIEGTRLSIVTAYNLGYKLVIGATQ